MSVAIQSPTPPTLPQPLTSRAIFRFFLPLALSWIFMSVESPVSVAIISRLPDAEVSTAAFFLMMGIAMWIESPVIDLLSTSTTLAKSRQNYVQLSRFVWFLLGAVTLVHALIVLTPLYWTVTGSILGVKPEVAEKARLGLGFMLPWSGFIGWRRFLQGILIRYGQTRWVGWGTAVRVGTIVLTTTILFQTTHMAGIQMAGLALVLSVAAEAAFIHWASREIIAERFILPPPSEGGELHMRKLTAFHLPLTFTTMIMLSNGPIVSAALSRVPDAIAQMAAFQVASTLTWLMRTTVYALPETVIALYKDDESARVLKRFCLTVGSWASGVMLLIWLTGADMWFFRHVLGAEQNLIDLAHLGFIAAIATPFLGAVQSYVRGMLTAHHLTVSRLTAISVHTICLGIGLTVGVRLDVSGVLFAGIAFTAALCAEMAVLAVAWKNGSRRTKIAAA